MPELRLLVHPQFSHFVQMYYEVFNHILFSLSLSHIQDPAIFVYRMDYALGLYLGRKMKNLSTGSLSHLLSKLDVV